jgi:cell wall-associated NlpC family hydrolase
MRSRLLSTLLAFALLALVLGKTARPAHAAAATSLSLEAKRAKVVRYARRFLGVRYRYGGASPRTGFDCSGFVAFVYRHFGVALPHYSVAQFSLGRRVPRRGLRAGDLVFFDGLGHVGIYVGRGRFIHAPHAGTRVSIEPLAGWYGARYDGARRLRIALP